MRLTCFLVACLFPAISPANAYDWTKVEQKFTRATIQGVAFTSSLSGLAVSADGLVLRTLDGGRKWARIHRSSGALNGVSIRGNLAVAVRPGFAVVSRDGGASFIEIPLPSRVTVQGMDIDASGGIWLSGMGGRIFHSRDQGATWEDVSPGRPEPLFCVRILDGGMVLAGGRGGLWVRGLDGIWLKSAIKTGMQVLDVRQDSTGMVWMLARKGEYAMLWRCRDINKGCDQLSREEADWDRLEVGNDYLWLRGREPGIYRVSRASLVPFVEKMPDNFTGIRSSCLSPDGTIWVAGDNGVIFRGSLRPDALK